MNYQLIRIFIKLKHAWFKSSSLNIPANIKSTGLLGPKYALELQPGALEVGQCNTPWPLICTQVSLHMYAKTANLAALCVVRCCRPRSWSPRQGWRLVYGQTSSSKLEPYQLSQHLSQHMSVEDDCLDISVLLSTSSANHQDLSGK